MLARLRHMVRRGWTLLLIGYLLNMGSISAQEPSPTPEDDAPPRTLTIWWPDALASPEQPDVLQALTAQTTAFAAENNLDVETRIKSDAEVGGLMSTLRSASAVAPGALPDVTLLTRQQLLQAERTGLIQTLEGRVPTGIVSGLQGALQLGQIDGELYGLPYMLEALQIAYRPQPGVDYESWSYDGWLARGEPLTFAAGRTRGLNRVAYLQYALTGDNTQRDGTLSYSEPVLFNLLSFYELASDAGLIDGFNLNYGEVDDYMAAFRAGEIDQAVMESTTYLRLLNDEPEIAAAPIPTPMGDPATVLDGWMWVLVTTDIEQQRLVTEYLTTMMRPDFQAEVAHAAHMLPSQRTLISEVVERSEDIAFYNALLDNFILPLVDSEGGSLARRIQESFASVLTKERSAQAAAAVVTEQQNNE